VFRADEPCGQAGKRFNNGKRLFTDANDRVNANRYRNRFRGFKFA